ncbi:hypothetical protein ACOSP7_013594 [Xanthoceras sorbifolium]
MSCTSCGLTSLITTGHLVCISCSAPNNPTPLNTTIDVATIAMFERVIKNSMNSINESEFVKHDDARGVFALNCTGKWFLTTGRRPMPMVAAVVCWCLFHS